MKCIVVHSNYDVLNKNSSMLNGLGHVSVSDFLYQMYMLNTHAQQRGIKFVSSECYDKNQVDSYIFVDCPDGDDKTFLDAINSRKPIFLLVWESDLINRNNHNVEIHKCFTAIFTYDNDIIDNIRYFKIAYNFNFAKLVNVTGDPYERKLLCSVSGNNYLHRPGELYTLRRNLIDWYSTNHPDLFDLYGIGWGKIVPPTRTWHKIYNKMAFLHPYFSNYGNCYRGVLDDKIGACSRYKFQICFENSASRVGYISEKLFHGFFSRNVPIYYGSDGTLKEVPDDCFIDFKNFKGFDELHLYISQMSRNEYHDYLECANNFLNSDLSNIFKTEYFCRTVLDTVQLKLEVKI